MDVKRARGDTAVVPDWGGLLPSDCGNEAVE